MCECVDDRSGDFETNTALQNGLVLDLCYTKAFIVMKSTESNKEGAQSKGSVLQSQEKVLRPTDGGVTTTTVIAKTQSFVKVLREKWHQLNQFRFKDMRRVAKETRKFLRLTKSPKRKGYDKFLTDDEKR